MPPKEHSAYTVCFYNDHGELVEAPQATIQFDETEMDFDSLPWSGMNGEMLVMSLSVKLKRKPSVEFFFSKKHRHNASVARKKRKHQKREKNRGYLQNNSDVLLDRSKGG